MIKNHPKYHNFGGKMKKVQILGLSILLFGGFFMMSCVGDNIPNVGTREIVPSEENAEEAEMGDFSLVITVSSDTLEQGQDIEVIAVFKNQSGEKLDISRGFFITVPIVIDSEHYQGAVFAISIRDILEIDAVITDTWQIGSLLPRGKHALVVIASFNLLEMEGEKVIAAQRVLLESNPIILTVY